MDIVEVKEMIIDLQEYEEKDNENKEELIKKIFEKHEKILTLLMNEDNIIKLKDDMDTLQLLMKTLEYFVMKYIE